MGAKTSLRARTGLTFLLAALAACTTTDTTDAPATDADLAVVNADVWTGDPDVVHQR